MYRDTYSGLLRTPLPSDAALASLPFPPPFPGSDINTIAPNLLTSRIPKPSVNRFQVLAGQSLEEWEKAGWIWPGDPRGWAEWYVRFWDGRRCEDDERQVRRCAFCFFFSPFCWNLPTFSIPLIHPSSTLPPLSRPTFSSILEELTLPSIPSFLHPVPSPFS